MSAAPEPAAPVAAAEPPVAALATAPGPAGVAVVRLSGAGALPLADRLCAGARTPPSALPAGSFRLFRLRDPRDGSPLDEALVLVFRAPHSYTGEDVAEFQVHGGREAPSRVLSALFALGAAPAGPGEFTRRAFLNGRRSLDEAEAVMDLVGAQGERAARAAAEQLSGALGRRIDALFDGVLALCADVEATLDFTDEEAEGLVPPDRFVERAAALAASVRALSATRREGRLLREGALVVLSGPVNAGKSTLFNRLLGDERAIVSPEAGTTRDAIEETLLLRGVPVRLADTAGLREADSAIEREGVGRARSLAARADLVLRVVPAGDFEDLGDSGDHLDHPTTRPPDHLDHQTTRPPAHPPTRPPDHPTTRPPDHPPLLVLTKRDLAPDAPVPPGAVAVSAKTGEGMETLATAILDRLGASSDPGGQQGVAVSERHAALLDEAAAALDEARARNRAAAEADAVLVAAALRRAAEALGRITGRTYTEDLLDAVFGRFCVGK